MLMQRWSIFLAVFWVFVVSGGSLNAYNVNKAEITKYYNKSQQIRIKLFQKDFTRALKHPENMKWIGEIFADGFRSDLGYNTSPSFVAYIDLHQGFYDYFKEVTPNFPIPEEVRKDFKVAYARFLAQVPKLGGLKDVEIYEEQLNFMYKEFLVGFINKHNDFFKARFVHDTSIEPNYNGGRFDIDIIDCAFFALQKNWPGFETMDAQYQFEQLYGYRCEDGRTLILGYNNRPGTCDTGLNIYIWDPKSPGDKPVKITQPMAFDLSPIMYEGGCGHRADVPAVINFIERRFLQFYGYSSNIFRYYIYDVKANKWKITEIPTTISKL